MGQVAHIAHGVGVVESVPHRRPLQGRSSPVDHGSTGPNAGNVRPVTRNGRPMPEGSPGRGRRLVGMTILHAAAGVPA